MFWTQAGLALLLVIILSLLPGAPYSWVSPSAGLYPFIALMGVVGSAGHYCLTQATAAVDATVVGPMDFVRVPLTALMGYSLYAEPLSAFLFIGAALILAGNLLNRGQRSSDFR
jgi:drug/metabolite transporter (DMT)-like permease